MTDCKTKHFQRNYWMFHVVYIDSDMQYVILGHLATLLCLLQKVKWKFLKNLQNTSVVSEITPVHQISWLLDILLGLYWQWLVICNMGNFLTFWYLQQVVQTKFLKSFRNLYREFEFADAYQISWLYIDSDITQYIIFGQFFAFLHL